MTATSSVGRPERVSKQLRSWILDGSLPPGQRLPVRDVARGLGVSTMPVREALVRLEEVGLVTQQKHRGAVVSQLSLDDLRDFYGLRRLLEPSSIQLGVESMTPERLTRIRSTMQELQAAVESGDSVTVLDTDEDVLALIHGAIGNRQIVRVIKSTWVRVRPYKLLFTTTAQADAGARILDENLRLLEVAAAGDGVAARELMFESLVNAELQLVDFLRGCDAATAPEALSLSHGESLATVLADLRKAKGRASSLAGD